MRRRRLGSMNSPLPPLVTTEAARTTCARGGTGRGRCQLSLCFSFPFPRPWRIGPGKRTRGIARGETARAARASRVSYHREFRLLLATDHSARALLRSPDTVINRVGSGRTRDRAGTNGSADGLIAMSALRNRFPGAQTVRLRGRNTNWVPLRRICTGEYVWETRSFMVCWRDGYDK